MYFACWLCNFYHVFLLGLAVCMMSSLIEKVKQVPLNESYAIGWSYYGANKIPYLLSHVPVEDVQFEDIISSCAVLDTVRKELAELGFVDSELTGGKKFLRVVLHKNDLTFSCFILHNRGVLYDVTVSFETVRDELDSNFYYNHIDEYYRLFIYLSCKFKPLRNLLTVVHPTYIAKRDDETHKWLHKLSVNDSIYID